MSSSIHADDKRKDISILGKGPKQLLNLQLKQNTLLILHNLEKGLY